MSSTLHSRTHAELVGEIQSEVAQLRAELAARETEVQRLRDAFIVLQDADANLQRIAAEQPRDDAEWKAADRKKRINDLAARYAGQIAGGAISDPDCIGLDYPKLVFVARALAAAVVEAEE